MQPISHIKSWEWAQWTKFSIFVFVTATFFIFFYYYPLALDDFWFLSNVRNFSITAEKPGLFTGYIKSAQEHYLHDNARLANTLFIFFLLLPKIVSAMVSTLSFAVTYWLMIKLTKAHTPFWFMTITGVMCVGLPWQDNLFITMYAMNYVWSAPWMLASIFIFLIKPNFNKLAAFAIGLITGLSHEAFAIPLVCAFALIITIRHCKLTDCRKLMIAGLAVGILWFLLSPSFIERFMRTIHIDPITLTRLNVLKIDLPFFVYLAIWIFSAIKKNTRAMAFSNICITMLVAGVAILAFHIFSTAPRATFPLVLLSAIGIITLLQKMSCGKAMARILNFAVAPLILIFLVLHLVVACTYIIRLNRNINQIYTEYANHTKKAVCFFATLTENHRLPWITLSKANFIYNSQWEFFQWNTFNLFANAKGVPQHTIVPLELKDYPAHEGIPLGGNLDAELYEGHIVFPMYKLRESGMQGTLFVTLGNSARISTLALFTGKDGKEYAVVFPVVLLSDFDRTPNAVNIL